MCFKNLNFFLNYLQLFIHFQLLSKTNTKTTACTKKLKKNVCPLKTTNMGLFNIAIPL